MSGRTTDRSCATTAWPSSIQRLGPHPPTGFAAAARLLHPPLDAAEHPATWARVAAHTGHHLGPDTSWEEVSSTVHTRRCTRTDWPGSEPDDGELGDAGRDALLDHLSRCSGAGAACYVAVDDIPPWVSGQGLGSYGDPHHLEPPQEPAFPPEVRNAAPRLEVGSRSYLLLTGPLHAVPTLGRTTRYRDQRWFERHSPACSGSPPTNDHTASSTSSARPCPPAGRSAMPVP